MPHQYMCPYCSTLWPTEPTGVLLLSFILSVDLNNTPLIVSHEKLIPGLIIYDIGSGED